MITNFSVLFTNIVEVRPAASSTTKKRNSSSSTPIRALQTGWTAVAGFFSLYKQRQLLKGADVYFVPYPAYLDLFFLRLLAPRRERGKIVIDGFLCLYDTVVNDRKLLKHNGLPARAVRWLERTTLSSVDHILIDTVQQKRLLLESYNIDENRITVTPVGIDEQLWTPLPPLPGSTPLRVLFWGTFIPLHGIETIVGAARLLEKRHIAVEITLIGDGQTANAIAEDLGRQPVSVLRWERGLVNAKALREKVEQAHCILGIFGTSSKAGNVIPYKAYQAMASDRILITRESSALREVLGNVQAVPGLRLVQPGSAEQLAIEIVRVQEDYYRIGAAPATGAAYRKKLSNALLKTALQDALFQLDAQQRVH